MKSILIVICLLAIVTGATAQNSVKLFDPTHISVSDPNVIMNSDQWGMFDSAEVYLSCSTSGSPTSSLSGPNGGQLIVDNALLINRSYVRMGNWFSSATNPWASIGMPVETVYGGIGPIGVSHAITGSGLYTFHLVDFSYNYGNSAIYLNTTCSIIPVNTPPNPDPLPSDYVICHRNNGSREYRTLTVGGPAISAHLAHGDTLGVCGQ